jgi:CMP-N-acetylneuraminic acid synthetase
LRSAADIDAARKIADAADADAVLGVTAVRQHAAWHKTIDARGRVVSLSHPPPSRQELPLSFCPNGAIYLCRTAVLRRARTLTPENTVPYEMPGSRSVDVDIPDDLVLAAAILGAVHGA